MSDQQQAENKRDQEAAALAALMPEDRAGLMNFAAETVAVIHAAVLAGDNDAAEAASARYEAAIWKINERTFFGCRADEKAAGNVIEQHCRAVPGIVPMWGQRGEFVITVGNVRALVEYSDGFGRLRTHFEFHAIDLDAPFISNTGYWSHFDDMHAGRTVDEVAVAIFADFLKTKRRYLTAEDQDRLESKPLSAWLAGLVPAPRRAKSIKECENPTESIPAGFVLVDVVLTAHQAFTARKWAEAAKPRIKAAREVVKAAEEQGRLNARDEFQVFKAGTNSAK